MYPRITINPYKPNSLKHLSPPIAERLEAFKRRQRALVLQNTQHTFAVKYWSRKRKLRRGHRR